MPELNTDGLIAVLNRHPDILAALLFGSFVKGPVTPESDVDIALLYDRKQPYDFMAQLALCEELRAVVNDRKVDLLNLLKADPIIKHQVFANCKILLMRDRDAYNQMWVQSMSAYADVKLTRKPIEDALFGKVAHD